MYQILKDAYDINNQLFTPSTLTATRGHTKKLFKHHTNSYTRSKIFSNRVINEWNPLPQFIDSSSVNKFKMLLDRHYSNCLLDYIAMVFIMANYIAMVTNNYKSLVSHTDEIMKSMRAGGYYNYYLHYYQATISMLLVSPPYIQQNRGGVR